MAIAAIAATVLAATSLRLRGPAPVAASAPPSVFSAARAKPLLSEILREEVPHPVGSPANAVVRDRIVARFQSLRYETRVERTFICNASLACAWVENIVATAPDAANELVFLVAHYDSVAAGPGASDDGVGVAALLESARALALDPRVAFLLTDGEEAGLLGAEAFVRGDPLRNRVKAVVNVENRGTSGPSFLFETSRGNRELIRAARALHFPLSSSLYNTVYDLLPNDTDVSVFKRAGVRALNFGAIGDVRNYHTARDNLGAVNERTLQHHGDNALAMARSLAEASLTTSSTNATWFDLFGLTIVSWPERWTAALAVLALLLVVVGAMRSPLAALAAGACAFIAILGSALGAAAGLSALAHLRSSNANWLAWPHLVLAAVWLAGVLPVAAASRLVSRWGDATHGVAVSWGVMGVALAVFVPGASYLLVVPLLLFAITSFASRAAAPIVWFTSSFVLIAPFALVLYVVLGRLALMAIALLIAIAASTTIALWSISWRVIGAGALAAIALAGVTALLPAYTPAHPKLERVRHVLPEPGIDVDVHSGVDRIVMTVRSRRDADQVIVSFDAPVRVLSVDGVVPAPPNRLKAQRSHTVTSHGSSAVIVLEHPSQPVNFTAYDSTFGVPKERVANRSASEVPYGRGDVTVSERKGTLDPRSR